MKCFVALPSGIEVIVVTNHDASKACPAEQTDIRRLRESGKQSRRRCSGKESNDRRWFESDLLTFRPIQALDHRIRTRTRIGEPEVESLVDVETANSNTQLILAWGYLVGYVAPTGVLPRAS